MVEAFLEDGRGPVVPCRGAEDDRAAGAAPVVAETEAVDRNGLVCEVQKKDDHSAQREAQKPAATGRSHAEPVLPDGGRGGKGEENDE